MIIFVYDFFDLYFLRFVKVVIVLFKFFLLLMNNNFLCFKDLSCDLIIMVYINIF